MRLTNVAQSFKGAIIIPKHNPGALDQLPSDTGDFCQAVRQRSKYLGRILDMFDLVGVNDEAGTVAFFLAPDSSRKAETEDAVRSWAQCIDLRIEEHPEMTQKEFTRQFDIVA